MPTELQTRQQIAERLGIKLSTLGTKLSILKFPATEVQHKGTLTVHYYGPAAVAKIEALFKKEG